MQALIVYCHPEPESFNAQLKDTAVERLRQRGYEVTVSDLYAEQFDPVEAPRHFEQRADTNSFSVLTEQRQAFANATLPPDVKREIDRLYQADLVVLQFPLWWHAQPAMLKGWFDRVFVYGGLYSGSKRYNRGPLQGKRAICSVTTGAPEATFSRHGRSGYMAHLMWPIHCSLYYLGLSVLAPQMHFGVQGGGLEYQQQADFQALLREHRLNWQRRLDGLDSEAPIAFSGWEDWDQDGVLKQENPAAWRL